MSDSNTSECDGDPNTTADWDGDYDMGVGGSAFGYGAWAEDADCNYALNVHGGNVAVNDIVFGSNIWFFVGEDDQSGPIKVQDPVTLGYTCTTDGHISACPNTGCDPNDPTHDPDDCLSILVVGTGHTCGTGGGDGLYWVFFPYLAHCEVSIPPTCRVNPNEATEATLGVGNLATSGTITAY